MNVFPSLLHLLVVITLLSLFLPSSHSYFSALILVEGMEIDSLHERVLDDRIEEHKFAGSGQVRQVNLEPILCSYTTTA